MSFQSKALSVRYIDSNSNRTQILLLVHGRGGRLPLMEFMAKRGHLKRFDFLLVEAPHAEFVPEMKVPGFSWFLSPGQRGLEESRRKISDLFLELEAFGYSRSKIFWLGFSQGCVMGLDTALRSDKQFGGVVGVSGFCLSPGDYPAAFGAAAKETPIFVTTGTRDQIVPADRAMESFQHLQSLGVPLAIREYNKPHSFDLKTEIPEIESWLLERI